MAHRCLPLRVLTVRGFVALQALALTCAAAAQSLPPPSRTVYQCIESGRVQYSDAPCLGARKIEVEPTRGLNKSSGQERIGADVRREHFREGLADALRPLTGMDAKQLDRAGRRMKLSPDAQALCRRLDRDLPLAEQAERGAPDAAGRQRAQEQVYALRRAFRSTGCD